MSLGCFSGRRNLVGGFSLVELLVVLGIMATLASIGMPLMELAQRRTQEESLRRSLREIRTALDEYKRLVDTGRIASPAGGTGYPPSLEVLVDGVDDARSAQKAKIFLMRRLPSDPLAKETVNVSPADTWGLRSYASPPQQPEAGMDVYDIYSKAPGNGLNGVPYRQW
jgi:general secretion pathway protein G